MSASSYSTVSHIIPLFNIVIDHVEDAASGSGGGVERRIRTAATVARAKLVEYYSKTNPTTMLCTALDPRRKFYYFTKRGFPEDEINETKLL